MMRIMVVEDELVSRQKLSYNLKVYGIVNDFEDGESALIAFEKACIEKNYYSLVTLDIGMPKMGGLVVLNKMRAIEDEMNLSPENRAKIVMVTSHDDEMSIKFALSQKCDDYIIKPFEKSIIQERLERIGFVDPATN